MGKSDSTSLSLMSLAFIDSILGASNCAPTTPTTCERNNNIFCHFGKASSIILAPETFGNIWLIKTQLAPRIKGGDYGNKRQEGEKNQL